MHDTSPDIRRRHLELLRDAGPERRLRMGLDLTRRTIASAWEGLCRTHPNLSEREREILWVRLNYGPDLADRLEQFLSERGRPAA